MRSVLSIRGGGGSKKIERAYIAWESRIKVTTKKERRKKEEEEEW